MPVEQPVGNPDPEVGYVVTVAVRNALMSDPHPAAVQRHLELALHDLEVIGSTHGR